MMRSNSKLMGYSVRSVFFFAVVLFSLSACQKRVSDPRVVLDREYKEQILAGREAMQIYMVTSGPGATVSVSIDGKTVWSEGFGYANKELRAPARPETKFRIGRTSQVFAAMLVARMQEKGLINLDSTVNTYIPNYPKRTWSYAIRDLGTHSAGFPETNMDLVFNKKKYRDLHEYVHDSANDTLLYPANEYFTISDFGTCMLGIVAETVGKKSYSKLVQSELLDTLGLKETVLDNPNNLIDNRATPYYQNFIAQLVNCPEVDTRFVAPAYGYLSTADDLNKLGQLLLNRKFFSKESYDLFLTANKLKGGYQTNFGFGWQIFVDNRGRTVYIQQGATIGGNSFLAIFPEQKLVISMCSNLGENTDNLPTGKIAQLFLDRIDPREAPKKNGQAPDPKKQEAKK